MEQKLSSSNYTAIRGADQLQKEEELVNFIYTKTTKSKSKKKPVHSKMQQLQRLENGKRVHLLKG